MHLRTEPVLYCTVCVPYIPFNSLFWLEKRLSSSQDVTIFLTTNFQFHMEIGSTGLNWKIVSLRKMDLYSKVAGVAQTEVTGKSFQ